MMNTRDCAMAYSAHDHVDARDKTRALLSAALRNVVCAMSIQCHQRGFVPLVSL